MKAYLISQGDYSDYRVCAIVRGPECDLGALLKELGREIYLRTLKGSPSDLFDRESDQYRKRVLSEILPDQKDPQENDVILKWLVERHGFEVITYTEVYQPGRRECLPPIKPSHGQQTKAPDNSKPASSSLPCGIFALVDSLQKIVDKPS